MKIALPLCLVLGVMSSEVALAAHYHRPNPAAAHSGPKSDDAAKSPVTQGAPADAAPSSSAAGARTGDVAAPIDTSITVNQGHRPLTRKEAAEKKVTTALEKLIPAQAKPHPPAHPFTAHAVAHRNAVGAVVQHSGPRTTANHAAAATGASAPATPSAQPSPPAGTPAPHDASGTAAPAPKSPAAISAAANEHSAAVLRTVTANGPSINGTSIKKPDTATAAVGGPAKAVAAAVGGSSFRPKHP